MSKPEIIVFCGSSRFVDIMAYLMWTTERDEGKICLGLHLLPDWACKDENGEIIQDHLAEHDGVAEKMDELHFRKIDLADIVFIVNYEGYIGESTLREIIYARDHCKRIVYLESRLAPCFLEDVALAAAMKEMG